MDLEKVFTLLETGETHITESIQTLIQDNLKSTKESWLIHSLVDYFYMTQSRSVVGILCAVQDPHNKFLLEKLHDGIKSHDHQLNALQLLLHIVCRQPSWISKVVHVPVLKVVIKCLKSETNIPVLMTGVTIVAILLPSIPTLIGTYLPDLFEIFNRLASFSIKKQVGNTPDIFLLHLQIAVYALFHRLYGMFPYNFLTYLRHYYTKKDNGSVFDEVIKCMIERVRLHPLLITGNKDFETSPQRWRSMETHDVVMECAKMSLDPIEGTWEELHCPIIAGRYTMDHHIPSHDHSRIPPISAATLPSSLLHPDLSHGAQLQDFCSPSEMIGLTTPPTSHRGTPATSILETSQTTSHPGPTVVIHSGSTPMNTPRETPPISEEHDRTYSRTHSRGMLRVQDPKRLSAEFVQSQTVPQLTPSSLIPSVPPSPLKTEFTNTPPFGLKTLPAVLNASRKISFDHDDTGSKPLNPLNQSELSLQKDVIATTTKINQSETVIHKDSKTIQETSQESTKSETATKSGEEKLKTYVPFIVGQIAKAEEFTRSTDSRDSREFEQSQQSQQSNLDTVSLDNLSQVIEDLNDDTEDSDDEVCELTSSSRLRNADMLTADSVAKFMKSVNRIRFNSLSSTNSIEQISQKFGSKNRSRSCPQFPKIENLVEEEDELSRSVSTTNTGIPNILSNLNQVVFSNESPTSDNLCNVSISSTNSTVTVNTKQETTVTITTSKVGDINVGKCPVFAESGTAEGSDVQENEFVLLLKQLLNPSPSVVCRKCQGHVEDKGPDPSLRKPFFGDLSPPELLDQHIRLGGDIHAKELSQLPIPSTQNVNWTHFGGVPPADEINILRGQLTLLHNQLMYERHKRDQHAKRNRRLLRKIANTKMWEEQKNALADQLKQHEMKVRDLHVSLKLVEEENLKLRTKMEKEEYEKLVQFKTCLQENEDLKNVKKEFNMLLVTQREEQEALHKKLNATEAKLFNKEKELEAIQEKANLNVKLKEQVIQLQKELLLMGELQQKSQEKILSSKTSKARRFENDNAQATLRAQLKDAKTHLSNKSVQLDTCRKQLSELDETTSNKDVALSELKIRLDKLKISHDDELQCIEDKHMASLRINQSLESHILQLYTELDELKFRQQRVGDKRRSPHDESPRKDDDTFRERTNSDPAQKPPHTHKPLTRKTSEPVSPSGNKESLGSVDLEGQRSPTDFTPRGQVFSQTVSERSPVLESREAAIFHAIDRQTQETSSVLSTDSGSSLSQQQGARYLDSEDTSVSTRSHTSTLGDSGFC